MIVTCAGRQLKQPIEFEIPDEQYEEITKLESENQQNFRIHELAMTHVKKYRYDLVKVIINTGKSKKIRSRTHFKKKKFKCKKINIKGQVKQACETFK